MRLHRPVRYNAHNGQGISLGGGASLRQPARAALTRSTGSTEDQNFHIVEYLGHARDTRDLARVVHDRVLRVYPLLRLVNQNRETPARASLARHPRGTSHVETHVATAIARPDTLLLRSCNLGASILRNPFAISIHLRHLGRS